MENWNWFHTKSRRSQEGGLVVIPHETGLAKLFERGLTSQMVCMLGMTIQEYATTSEQAERGRVDVIAMGVGQDRRQDPIQGRGDRFEALGQDPRTESDVDQEAARASLEKRCVSPRSACEDSELNAHS
jgi:hypothetical protein